MGTRLGESQATAGARGAPATDPDLTAIEHALGAAWLHAALESTRGFVAVHDVGGTLRYVSPNVIAVLGHAPEDLTGPMPTHLVHPDDRDVVIEKMTGVLDQPHRVETLAFRAVHANGSWRWLETQVVNLVEHPGSRAWSPARGTSPAAATSVSTRRSITAARTPPGCASRSPRTR
jgi:PAS domain S-box-containing protein